MTNHDLEAAEAAYDLLLGKTRVGNRSAHQSSPREIGYVSQGLLVLIILIM
jgi:hypothetical protein